MRVKHLTHLALAAVDCEVAMSNERHGQNVVDQLAQGCGILLDDAAKHIYLIGGEQVAMFGNFDGKAHYRMERSTDLMIHRRDKSLASLGVGNQAMSLYRHSLQFLLLFDIHDKATSTNIAPIASIDKHTELIPAHRSVVYAATELHAVSTKALFRQELLHPAAAQVIGLDASYQAVCFLLGFVPIDHIAGIENKLQQLAVLNLTQGLIPQSLSVAVHHLQFSS